MVTLGRPPLKAVDSLVAGRLPEDTWKRHLKQRETALRNCYDELRSFERAKLTLSKPTFFIPGWTAEDAKTWFEEFSGSEEFYKPVEYWLDRIILNRDFAKRITLEKESSESTDIFQFGEKLKRRLDRDAAGSELSLVGHSMGGLVSRAAVYCGEGDPLRVNNFITLGTPNRGAYIAQLFNFKRFTKFFSRVVKSLTPQEVSQAQSMAMNSQDINRINSLDCWKVISERINNFLIFMGMKDLAVQNSPELQLDEALKDALRTKIRTYQTSGAEHTGRHGITQDPRILLPVIKALCGMELKDNNNHGFMVCR